MNCWFAFKKKSQVRVSLLAELLSGSSPLDIDIAFSSSEASRNLNKYILELDRWLYENFNLRLKGHWQLEVDDGDFRCEIAEGTISDAALNWLEAYTVEQINDIRKYAESTYPPESTSTSDALEEWLRQQPQTPDAFPDYAEKDVSAHPGEWPSGGKILQLAVGPESETEYAAFLPAGILSDSLSGCRSIAG